MPFGLMFLTLILPSQLIPSFCVCVCVQFTSDRYIQIYACRLTKIKHVVFTYSENHTCGTFAPTTEIRLSPMAFRTNESIAVVVLLPAKRK